MAIEDYPEHEFADRLSEYISFSEPIDSIEHLFGREEELKTIKRALFVPGRHVFIFGDRGVGKSSLAATAASQYQSVDAPYIDIGCGTETTLFTVVANIVYKAFEIDRIFEKSKTTRKSISFRGLSLGGSSTSKVKDIKGQIDDIVDAVEFLRLVADHHSESPIVVIDEFDRINSKEERARFADLIKILGDKRIHLKFIFTGVAKSLDELIGAHASAIRQIQAVEVPRLSINARWDVLRHAARAFGLTVDHEVEVRVAMVSDGFPYYLKVMGHALLWKVYDIPEVVHEITWDHYVASIPDAINTVDFELKEAYETAVLNRSSDYEEVLWGTADTEWLDRTVDSMYWSYCWVSEKLNRNEILTKKQFSSRLQNLRKKEYGEIITPRTKRGMYTYKEKIFRGFVRLQAEAHGITLSGEALENREIESARAPISVRTGYHASTIPKGVKFEREKKKP